MTSQPVLCNVYRAYIPCSKLVGLISLACQHLIVGVKYYQYSAWSASSEILLMYLYNNIL